MTKRTAALAADAKLSSKARKVATEKTTTSTANAASKKQLAAASKRATTSSKKNLNTKPSNNEGSVAAASSSSEQLPWYAVYTKSDPEYDTYMSTEWGYEKRGDTALFEKICLEGAQSGLSWLTILRKREAYRKTFHNFDISSVAKMTPKDIQKILDTNEADPRDMIVRHRGKIEATINNAKCIQTMYEEAAEEEKDDNDKGHGLFDTFLWSFVQNKPILNTQWKQGQSLTTALSKSPESEAMSKALKKLGFRFVGPTTCYAMMQSVGMVIDHPQGSPEWEAALERLKQRPGGYQRDTDVDRDDNDGNNNKGRKEVEQEEDSKPKAKKAKTATTKKKSNRK